MKKLGKYELSKKLGEGASSTVFLGHDPFAQRDVAIKVATPEILSDPKRGKIYTNLFLNEASLVGQLNHPHIVQIYDAVVAENLCYIVMEYVTGSTLEKHTQPSHLLPIDRVVELIFKCTRALAFAHRIGITHRDIKPANLLITTDGDIKISDFGAAISIHQNDRTLVSGIGSPAYMSPEQIQDLTLDHRTDIYSLGVVMFQLLTGCLPFQADSPFNMIYQIMHSKFPSLARLRPDLPDGLEKIVSKATANAREARYQTWEEFSQDLAEIVRDGQSLMPKTAFAATEKFDILRALPFFVDFSDVEIWEALRFSEWRHITPGTVIMHDGEPGDFFCFLANGELKISKAGRTLNTLSEGACFGEMAVINRSAQFRSADVTAVSDADIITIRDEALQQASDSCQRHFYQGFLAVLAARLSLANEQLATSN